MYDHLPPDLFDFDTEQLKPMIPYDSFKSREPHPKSLIPDRVASVVQINVDNEPNSTSSTSKASAEEELPFFEPSEEVTQEDDRNPKVKIKPRSVFIASIHQEKFTSLVSANLYN